MQVTCPKCQNTVDVLRTYKGFSVRYTDFLGGLCPTVAERMKAPGGTSDLSCPVMDEQVSVAMKFLR